MSTMHVDVLISLLASSRMHSFRTLPCSPLEARAHKGSTLINLASGTLLLEECLVPHTR